MNIDMKKREHDERRELPALGHGAGRDRRGGVHEDHLEQEQREDADVVGVAAQEEALACRTGPNVLPNSVIVNSWLSGGVPPSAPTAPTPPICSAKPQIQKPSMPIGVDHEVHAPSCGRRSWRGVKPGLDQREAGLHEHDEEAGDQRPHHVDGDLVVADRLHHFGSVGLAASLTVRPWPCRSPRRTDR